ncbi:putative pectinesterase/pectinesterase inhibitor 41 [Drosera capensis]
MHFHYFPLLTTLFLLLSTASIATPPGAAPAGPPTTATAVCNATLYPTFCKSILHSDNQTSATVYDYGRYSLRRSLSSASKFLSLIDHYLSRPHKLTVSALGALEDCRFLAQLNVDFIESAMETLGVTTLNSSQAEDVGTLMSAIVTNQGTCLDGLKATEEEWEVKNGLVVPMKTGAKLYSVALGLVTKGWVGKKKKKGGSNVGGGRKVSAFRGGLTGVRMTEEARRVYESMGRRRLLQAPSGGGDDDEVLVSDMVTVSQDGTGNFTFINDAIAAAPNKSDLSNGYYLIYVTAGLYEEYVSIPKNKRYLMMIGDGINQTIITGNRSYVDNYTTFNSATFAVVGAGFLAINITIRNTAGAIKHQAVALRNGADLSTFYSCSFEGYQDTLYAHSLRQFYRECDIYGTIDFIFGNSAAVFQDCNLYPRMPLSYQFNAITAQGRTDPNQNTGISIINCTIRAAQDLASSNVSINTYLGRPWKQYSRTVYIQSDMGDVIDPAGWTEWNGTFALDTLYYGEFNNHGPGANTNNRVDWQGYHNMNVTDANNYTVSGFLLGDNWLPLTGAPYFSGLS